MKQAVIDTNVLIRALINPLGAVTPVVVRLREGKYLLIYSEWLLNELKEKIVEPRIKVKYKLTDRAINDLLELIKRVGQKVNPTRTVDVCRDADDNHVIEAAIEGKADYIVTYDNDLLDLKSFETVRMITPREFLEILDV
ncbi:MAG: putative toxin-antitoxin system toxin component, PIN family [Chloroflexota bacterium]